LRNLASLREELITQPKKNFAQRRKEPQRTPSCTTFVYNNAMSERISEGEFQQHAEQAITELERAFGALAEDRDLDVELEGGVLSVTFEEGEPGRFIVSPNSSVRQVWVSARVSSLKFDWSAERNEFLFPATGETLKQAMTRLTQEQLGDSSLVL
jgi:iron-sulfur cluster assembly protein CyaY